MQKLFLIPFLIFFSTLQGSTSPLTRTDSRAPRSKTGKRVRTPSPETKVCAFTNETISIYPENPSAPLKNDFLKKYEQVIAAFIQTTPDQLAKHTFSIQYKPSTGSTVLLSMKRGTAQLTLTHFYPPKEAQNLLETAQLCDNLANMTVDDSILFISEK